MHVAGVIAQLRTTDLKESIRFYTQDVGLALEFQYEDFYAGITAKGAARRFAEAIVAVLPPRGGQP